MPTRTVRKRWYVGGTTNHRFEAFRFDHDPIEGETPYLYVIGPFRTRRGARWAEKYGKGNPRFGHVEDAERLARCAL